MHTKDIEQRHEAEKDFHEKKYASSKRMNYYDAGFKSTLFGDFIKAMGNIKGKKVLEFGCGDGWMTKKLASLGAEVWAFDISEEAVHKATELMKRHHLQDRVHIDQMTAEKLLYDDGKFDLVVGNAILHHLDLELSSLEIRRVLKDNGHALFMEPLGHNLFLNLYRLITPNLRSRDETPLRFEQFSVFEKTFSRFEHTEYYLTAILALFWHFLNMNSLMLRSRDALAGLDRSIFKTFPGLRRYCWYSILMMKK